MPFGPRVTRARQPSVYTAAGGDLVANPVVTVEVGRETIAARATVTEEAERDRLFAAHAAAFPYFVSYQKKTGSVIPVVLLERIG